MGLRNSKLRQWRLLKSGIQVFSIQMVAVVSYSDAHCTLKKRGFEGGGPPRLPTEICHVFVLFFSGRNKTSVTSYRAWQIPRDVWDASTNNFSDQRTSRSIFAEKFVRFDATVEYRRRGTEWRVCWKLFGGKLWRRRTICFGLHQSSKWSPQEKSRRWTNRKKSQINLSRCHSTNCLRFYQAYVQLK